MQPGCSNRVIRENARRLERAGGSPKQAQAIARKYASLFGDLPGKRRRNGNGKRSGALAVVGKGAGLAALAAGIVFVLRAIAQRLKPTTTTPGAKT